MVTSARRHRPPPDEAFAVVVSKRGAITRNRPRLDKNEDDERGEREREDRSLAISISKSSVSNEGASKVK